MTVRAGCRLQFVVLSSEFRVSECALDFVDGWFGPGIDECAGD